MNIKTDERILVPVLAVTISLTLVFLGIPEFPLAHAQTTHKSRGNWCGSGCRRPIFKTYRCGIGFRFGRSWAGIGLGFVGEAGFMGN